MIENIIPYERVEQDLVSVLQLHKKFLLGWNLFNENKIKRPPELSRRIFSLGSTNLLEYGSKETKNGVILIIPSLINRYYILDLSPKYSLIEYLCSLGYRVFVIEWDEPIRSEYSFRLKDYVTERILPILNLVERMTQQKVLLLGYCLGGTLAVMTSFIAKVKGLILIATPWDFSQMIYLNVDYDERSYPIITAEQIKRFFWCIDFERVWEKFIAFSSSEKNSEKYKKFLKVESWVDHGISVTRKVFRDITTLSRKGFLKFRGHKVGGQLINHCSYEYVPKLVIVSSKDKIIPSTSSLPLSKTSNISTISLDAGHIGIFINDRAKNELYNAIKRWSKEMRN